MHQTVQHHMCLEPTHTVGPAMEDVAHLSTPNIEALLWYDTLSNHVDKSISL